MVGSIADAGARALLQRPLGGIAELRQNSASTASQGDVDQLRALQSAGRPGSHDRRLRARPASGGRVSREINQEIGELLGGSILCRALAKHPAVADAGFRHSERPCRFMILTANSVRQDSKSAPRLKRSAGCSRNVRRHSHAVRQFHLLV
jgi:hypothetical protein